MSDPDSLSYRRAEIADAAEISARALESQAEFAIHEYSDAGRERIKSLSLPHSIEQYFERGDIYFVAEHGKRIVGAIGVQGASHIVQMFVEKQWHRQGIGAELWRLCQAACLAAGNPGCFTLNASTYAIPVYERWGFEIVGERQNRAGIVTTPMKLEFDVVGNELNQP